MYSSHKDIYCYVPRSIGDGVVHHMIVGVVANDVALRHHPHQGLLVPGHSCKVVKVQVVRVDEESGSNSNLGLADSSLHLIVTPSTHQKAHWMMECLFHQITKAF